MLPAETIAALKGLRQHVQEAEHADQFIKQRTFGVNGTGQETVFLHAQLDERLPSLRAQLQAIAKRISDQAGWALPVPPATEPKLTLRCVELLRYRAAGAGSNDQGKEGVGWHADGATLLTMAFMLSDPSAFEGGAVELRRNTGVDAGPDERHDDLRPGDVVGWKGWTNHRVAPVTAGVREVFVVEWWVGEDCADTLDMRGDDTEYGLRYAISKDAASGFLHRTLAELLCEQLPCDGDAERAADAESEFRLAAALSPEDAATVHGLGYFLLGSRFLPQRAEGVGHLLSSHRLNPAQVAAIPAAVQALGTPPMICRINVFQALCDHVPVDMAEKLGKLALAAGCMMLMGAALWCLDGGEGQEPQSQQQQQQQQQQLRSPRTVKGPAKSNGKKKRE